MSDEIILEEWDEAFNNPSITFHSGPAQNTPEMLRIDKNGFYVRGVRVEADAKEAEHVYLAFKQWLTWNALVTK